jgi:predicted nucleotidyltransferase
MAVSEAHRRHWQQRWAAEARAIEQLRQASLAQAEVAADRLRQRWPGLGGIWVFGSLLGEGFAAHSDIDLAVEGLPTADLLTALAVAEAAGAIPLDLVRLESLPPHWQQRIRAHGRRLA